MILTASHIHVLAEELKASILGWRIVELFASTSERALILQLGLRSMYKYILLSAHPEFCRAELLEKRQRNWQKGSQVFAAIKGGYLKDISQLDFDRALDFSIQRETEIGEVNRYRLISELVGPQANLILVDAETGRISQCLRLSRAGKRKARAVLPGKPYSPLTKGDKLSPLELDFEKLSWLAEKKPGTSLKSLMTSNIWGVNDSIMKEISARSGIGLQIKGGDLSKENLIAISRSIQGLYSPGASEEKKAAVIVNEKGDPKELLFYLPVKLDEKLTKRFSSLLEATSFFYENFIKGKQIQRGWMELGRKLSSLITKARRRQKQLQGRLLDSQRKDLYKTYGDLLMIHPDKKKRGQEQITVENVFSLQPEPVTIELDPKRSVLENARWYYRKFRKAAGGQRILEEELRKVRTDLEILERARENLESEPSEKLLMNLKRELTPVGITVKTLEDKKPSVKTPLISKFRPREFVTSDGWRLLVGRNDLENEYLTFKVASKEDIWFHARGARGSHVILRRPGKKCQASKASLEEAASLAAYFSKQRTSSKVSVSYTLVKHLRKPKKAKPGLVILQQEKSILAEPRLLRPAESPEAVND